MLHQIEHKTPKRKLPSILVLTTTYPSDEEDPAGIFISKLVGAIHRRGFPIKVLAPTNGRFHGKRTVHGIETIRFGYFVPRYLERLTVLAGGIPENMAASKLARLQLPPMMLVFLIKTLIELKSADIIYANWIGAGLIGAIANQFTGKPLIVSFRGDDGYLARDRRLWRTITQWVISRAAFVAPVSRELGNIMISLGLPEDKCKVPKFGVDMEMFHPEIEKKASSEKVEVLFVGSLIRRKGLHDLLTVLGRPEFNSISLTVIGEGVHEPEFRTLAEKMGINDRINWLGALSPQVVAHQMRKTDILCLPSYMEGRPNVVNEAMASEIPVISTTIGGIPDMVEEGSTAFLFEPGNHDQLAECLSKLVADPELRRTMGKNGRNFLITSGVSWDSTAEEFDELFCKAMFE